MAISNIFREPRREIIEQAWGLAAVILWLALAFAVVAFIGFNGFWDAVVGTAMIGAAMLLIIPVAVFIHAIGETVCGWLARAGRDPRPRQRY